jgi:hypothetical protein
MKRKRLLEAPELSLGPEPFRLVSDTLETVLDAPSLVLDGAILADLPDSTGELV